MLIRIISVVLAAALAFPASAATHNVSTIGEFQTALTTAQSNGEDDTINVAAGTYDAPTAATLTYTAGPNEEYSLSILGADSTTVLLNGGAAVPILRIDTTALSMGDAVGITVTNMTFLNGNAIDADGGGLFIDMLEGMMVMVSGSEFYGNTADGDGGAIFIRGNVLEGIYLSDLTIDGNSATGIAAGRTGDGGGVQITAPYPTAVFLEDIDFFNNTAVLFGGGLEVNGDSEETGPWQANLYDIMFENNSVTGAGGSGGGASLLALDVWINLVGFVTNDATELGGGLHLREYSRNRTINSGFVGNTARIGGGMGTDAWNGSGIVLEHNTFTENAATNAGGGAYLARGAVNPQIYLYNNIVWGNFGETAADLYVDDDPNNTAGNEVTEVTLYNNDFSDFTTRCTLNVDCTPIITAGNNIDADPLLTSDIHLMMGSPAIDAGDNIGHVMYPVVDVDFDFDARPFDGDNDGTATSDIGIDEYVGGVAQDVDLAIAMTDNPDPVLVDGVITYSVTVTNNGPGDATGVGGVFQHTDTLFLDAVVSQGSWAAGFGLVQWDIGDLANGASATATIEIQHLEETGSQILVSSDASVSGNETDSDLSDNEVTEDTTVVQPVPDSADLAITKVGTPDPVVSGGPTLTYDITVTNNGPEDATGVTMNDALPVGLIFDGVTTTVGTCSETAGTVSCDIGDLAVDAMATIAITTIPEPVGEPTNVINTAIVAGTLVDPVAGNDASTATTVVNPPESDMMVTVVGSPASPSIGETVTYDITITNDGPSHNLGVDLAITLPAMGTFQNAMISQGACGAPKAGMINCAIGDMFSGETVTAQVIVTAPDEATSLALSAAVSGSVSDPAGANNTASDAVTVVEAVDLVIQGKAKGGGTIGWLELLFATAAIAAFRARRQLKLVLPCLAIAMLTLVPAGQAVAQGDWYVQATVGQVDLDYSASDLTSDLSSLGWTISNPQVDSSGTAWKVLGGFALNEIFAVEAGYVSLGEVMTQFGASIPPSDIDSLLSDTYSVHPYQGDGWVAAAVVSWPINPDRFSLYGRAGIFAWKSELDVRVIQGGTGSVSGDDSGTDAMYGVGVEWKLNETWSLTAEWERYRLKEWLDVPSAGVKVYF